MKTRILLIGLCVMGWAVCAQATTITYDAATNFSIANGNPNGEWSYGLMSGITPFSAFTAANDWTARDYAGIESWTTSGGWDPAVTHNSTGSEIVAFGFTWAPYTLGLDNFYCSDQLGFTTVRWTAPSAGLCNIAATFTQIGGDASNAYVFVNGVANYVGTVNSTGISWSNNALNVTAGDTINFLVAAPSSVTRLDATITQTVPEPSTMVLLGGGLLGLLCYTWRKRR